MYLREEILPKIEDFYSVCKAHNVKYVYAFGSAITDHFDPSKSDVDLVVEINESDPVERGDKLISLWDSLELFFNRKVDLLTERSIHNPYLKRSIDSSKILIYDGSRQQVFV